MDGGGFPSRERLYGPDGGHIGSRSAFRQQPDGGGLAKGNVYGYQRRAPAWTARANVGGSARTRRVISGNGVAIGAGGATDAFIARTTDGDNWVGVDCGAGTQDYAPIATDGQGFWMMLAGRLVASQVGVISVDDGRSWQRITMPVAATWNVLEFANGWFIAIEGGLTSSTVAYRSADGAYWEPIPMDRAAKWSGVAYSYDFGMWLAVSGDAANPIVSRSYDNGSSWAAVANFPTTPPTERTVWCKPNPNTDGQFLASTAANATSLFRTPNGDLFVATLGTLIAAHWVDCAVGQGMIYVTQDGTTAPAISEDGITFLTGTALAMNQCINSGPWHSAYIGQGRWVGLQFGSANAQVGTT